MGIKIQALSKNAINCTQIKEEETQREAEEESFKEMKPTLKWGLN